MDPQEQAEAGPSSLKPVFKKKKSRSRTVGLSVGSPRDEAGTDDKAAGASADRVQEDDDDDEDNDEQG